jgi:hypothetical protein
MLNAENEAKLTSQKYPENPFFWSREWASNSYWDDFSLYFKLQVDNSPSAPPLPPQPPQVAMDARSNPLGALARQVKGLDMTTGKYPTMPLDSTDSTTRAATHVTVDGTVQVPFSPLDGKTTEEQATTAISIKWYLSFKTPLYGAVLLLMAGIAAAIVFTVVTMENAGQSWMTSTRNSIDGQTTANMELISLAKSTYIKLYYKELILQTLLGAAFTTKLLHGDLMLPSWRTNGSFLRSYSVDPHNTYASSVSASNAYSGYYLTVGLDYSTAFPFFHLILLIFLNAILPTNLLRMMHIYPYVIGIGEMCILWHVREIPRLGNHTADVPVGSEVSVVHVLLNGCLQYPASNA